MLLIHHTRVGLGGGRLDTKKTYFYSLVRNVSPANGVIKFIHSNSVPLFGLGHPKTQVLSLAGVGNSLFSCFPLSPLSRPFPPLKVVGDLINERVG
jgi:hypothetical protein